MSNDSNCKGNWTKFVLGMVVSGATCALIWYGSTTSDLRHQKEMLDTKVSKEVFDEYRLGVQNQLMLMNSTLQNMSNKLDQHITLNPKKNE